MKATKIMSAIAAGMLTFVMVIMAGVLGLGSTKPAWATEKDFLVTCNSEIVYDAGNVIDDKDIETVDPTTIKYAPTVEAEPWTTVAAGGVAVVAIIAGVTVATLVARHK